MSLMLTGYSLKRRKAFEKLGGVAAEASGDTVKRQKQIDGLEPGLRRKLFLAELALMVFENGLFTSFVLGMTSGI